MSHRWNPWRAVALLGAGATALWLAAGGGTASAATTTVTQIFERPARTSLRSGGDFFVEPTPPPTPEPTAAAAASPSVSARSAERPGPTSSPTPAPVALPSATPTVLVTPVATPRLPEKVDNASTESQLQQLARFERSNQMGEAYLLACKLVEQNPQAEFALDAAIHFAVILELDGDAEGFFRMAIKRSPQPGKYYAQLAHFYRRRHQAEKLKKLLTEFGKFNAPSAEYWLALGRMARLAGDATTLRTALERATKARVASFPLVWLAAQGQLAAGQPLPAIAALLAETGENLSPWQQRTVALELASLPETRAQDLASLLENLLGNAANPRLAHEFFDEVLSRATRAKNGPALKAALRARAETTDAPDAALWMAATLARDEAATTEALAALGRARGQQSTLIAYERAQLLAADGQSTEAAGLMETLLAEQPDSPAIRLLLAQVYLAAGRTTDAQQLLLAAELVDGAAGPERRRWRELALEAALRGGDAAALPRTWLTLARDADFAELLNLGDGVLRHSLPEGALPDWLEALREAAGERGSGAERAGGSGSASAPAPVGSLYLLEARLHSIGRDREAELAAYEKFVAADPENVSLIRFAAELASQYARIDVRLGLDSGDGASNGAGATELALTATSQTALEAAQRWYRRLIALQPRMAEHYAALVRLMQMQGMADAPSQVAAEIVAREPRNAETLALAANVLEQSGQPAEALGFYRQAFKIDLDNLTMALQFARALRMAGKTEESLTIYRTVLEGGLHGQPFAQAEVFTALLGAAQERGQVPALIEYLDGLRLRSIPGKAEFFLSAAKLCMQVQNLPKAGEMLADFERDFPGHKLGPDAELLAARLLFLRQENEAAEKAFARVAQRHPGTDAAAGAVLNLGEMKRQQGQAKAAIELWRGLAVTAPSTAAAAEALFEAGNLALDVLQQPELARQCWRGAADHAPADSALGPRALEQLARLPPPPNSGSREVSVSGSATPAR